MEMYECPICKKRRVWKNDISFHSYCDECDCHMESIGKYCPNCEHKLAKKYEGFACINHKCCMRFRLGCGWCLIIPRRLDEDYFVNKYDFDITRHENTKKWLRTKIQILSRDNHKCKVCSNTICLHVHHIISRSESPELTFDFENLMTLCEICHKKIHENDKYKFGGKD